MPAPSRAYGFTRRLALRSEELFQAGLRLGTRTWSAVAHRGRAVTASDLRGRRCHCPAGLPVHLVHSEALREACDFVVDFGSNVRARGRPVLPVPALRAAAAGLRRGASVHVKTDLLGAFVSDVLPAITEPIMLVTGDSDASPVQPNAALLDDPRVAHWFVQNCDWPGRHPKLTRLPIGFDNPIYTALDKRVGFLVTMALGRTPLDLTVSRNDIGDQALLQRVAASLPPPAERPARVLCTFHQNQKIIAPNLARLPERAEAHRILAANSCCDFPTRRLRQRECWARHGDYAFEASPRGNGLDCFRTWEALFLGTIPIVKTSTLDPLFVDHDLPVVIVHDWNEITPVALERWRMALQPKLGEETTRKLTADYWTEQVRRCCAQVAAGAPPAT